MKSIPHSKTWITEDDLEVIQDQLRNGYSTVGPVSKKFIKYFLDSINLPFGSLFSSGTSALYHILKSLDLKDSDEVLIPNYICRDVFRAVAGNGVTPKIYDNISDYWISSMDEIELVISDRTKAIVINHTFGIAFQGVLELKAKFPHIVIIEDCCHAIPLGGKIGEVDVLRSDYAFFSFNSTKLLAGGEGGLVASSNQERIENIHDVSTDKGMNDISSRLAINQLLRFSEALNIRRDIATRYLETFAKFDVIMPSLSTSLFFRFPIITRPEVIESCLYNEKVSYRRGVDTLINSFYSFRESCKNSESVFDRTISIPIYPSLTKIEIELILENTYNELNN